MVPFLSINADNCRPGVTLAYGTHIRAALATAAIKEIS